VAAVDLLVGEVEPNDFVVVEACPREAGQWTEIDMHVVVVVMTSNEAWQHARIGRLDVSTDHRQAHSREGLHAEHFEDGDMTVATPDQDEVFEDDIRT
jgi:hypothetical protein